MLDDLAMRRPWNLRVKAERLFALRRVNQLQDGVTVVIVNWNTMDVTADVVRAVQRFSPPATRILVVDNGSTDGSRELFQGWAGIDRLLLPGNAGHGVALDIALCRVRTRIAVTLDSDAIPLREGWLDQAVKPVRDGRAVLAGLRSSRDFVHPVLSAVDTEVFLRRNYSFQTFVPPGVTSESARWGENCWDTAELLTPRIDPARVVFVDPTPNAVPGLPGMTTGGVVYHHGGVSRGATGTSDPLAVQEWRGAWARLHAAVADETSRDKTPQGAPNPGLSVVIPAKDAAATLGDQLSALAASTLPAGPFEVIVADNGSSDNTVDIARGYASRLPVVVVDATKAPGANFARRVGVEHARYDRLLVCDSDDRVASDWVLEMSRAFDEGHQLVAGPIDYLELNAPHVRAWRGADSNSPAPLLAFLPAGHGANLGFTRSVYDTVGGFDADYLFGGDDVEFCWRAQLAGFPLHVVPEAVVHYRLRPSLRALYRQFKAYGASEAHLYRDFARRGLRRRPVNSPVSEVVWLVTRLPFAWPIERRGTWIRRLATLKGRWQGAFDYRVLWW